MSLGRDTRIAEVALARRLAGILYAMWRYGRAYYVAQRSFGCHGPRIMQSA